VTAVNTIIQSRAVSLITDGAVNTREFEVAKVWPMPHLNAAIAVRGAALALPLLSFALASNSRSFAHMKSTAVQTLQEALAHYESAFRLLAYGDAFDVVVGGFDGNRPDAFFVCNHDGHGVGPWQVVELQGVSLLPATPGSLAEMQAAFGGRDVESLDPERDGLALMDIQRRHVVKDAAGLDGAPGAFCQLTTIRRDAIETKIIHRWAGV
jgi:hypothetical protein